MEIIDRYLTAVAAQLPPEERADITAELRDLILSRFEAREAEQGRPLTDDEREAILREIGHPLVVAARYRKGPDSLIGPELFPYWLYAVKAGLLILLALHALGLMIDVVGGSTNFGQDISQAFHGFFGAALTLIGALTLGGAIMEHYAIRPKWLTDWRVKDLGAFNLSDPAQWGVAAGATRPIKVTPVGLGSGLTKMRTDRRWPGGDHLFSLLATGLFVFWWTGVLRFPALEAVTFGHRGVTVTGAPIWTTLYLPILIYALGQMVVDLVGLARPYALRLRAGLKIAIAGAGLLLNWAIWQAGHWFNVSDGALTQRVEGGRSFLSLETLERLGRGDNADLTIWATNMSGIVSWILVVASISLVCSVLINLWRLARGS